MGCSTSKQQTAGGSPVVDPTSPTAGDRDGYDRRSIHRRKQYVERKRNDMITASPMQMAAKLHRLSFAQSQNTYPASDLSSLQSGAGGQRLELATPDLIPSLSDDVGEGYQLEEYQLPYSVLSPVDSQSLTSSQGSSFRLRSPTSISFVADPTLDTLSNSSHTSALASPMSVRKQRSRRLTERRALDDDVELLLMGSMRGEGANSSDGAGDQSMELPVPISSEPPTAFDEPLDPTAAAIGDRRPDLQQLHRSDSLQNVEMPKLTGTQPNTRAVTPMQPDLLSDLLHPPDDLGTIATANDPHRGGENTNEEMRSASLFTPANAALQPPPQGWSPTTSALQLHHAFMSPPPSQPLTMFSIEDDNEVENHPFTVTPTKVASSQKDDQA